MADAAGPGRIEIPAREGRAVRLAAGDRVRVVDPEGGQVADTWAFRADDVSEYASASHTRAFIDRLFPLPGEPFVTNRRRPILTLVEDRSPGRHDMLIAACDPSRYEGLGVAGWHASCQENLQRAMAAVGHEDIEIPQPINLFMDIPVLEGDRLAWRAATTAPGDHVVLRAEVDLVLAVSACPQDIVVINGGTPTPIVLERL